VIAARGITIPVFIIVAQYTLYHEEGIRFVSITDAEERPTGVYGNACWIGFDTATKPPMINSLVDAGTGNTAELLNL
jgi:hypothetical protein